MNTRIRSDSIPNMKSRDPAYKQMGCMPGTLIAHKAGMMHTFREAPQVAKLVQFGWQNLLLTSTLSSSLISRVELFVASSLKEATSFLLKACDKQQCGPCAEFVRKGKKQYLVFLILQDGCLVLGLHVLKLSPANSHAFSTPLGLLAPSAHRQSHKSTCSSCTQSS
jgi:hypothetical protein